MNKFSIWFLVMAFSCTPYLTLALDIDQDPFAIAIRNKDATAVRNLLNSGRSPSEFYDPSSKMDFMYYAIISSNLEIVKMLEAAGGNLETSYPSGLGFQYQAICWFTFSSNQDETDISLYLISKRGNLDFECNLMHGTLINRAASFCKADVLRALIKKGIDVNKRASEAARFQTPIIAITNSICGNKRWESIGKEALTVLLEAGANPLIPQSKSNPDTAFSMSKRFPKMRKFLEEYLSSKQGKFYE